MTGCGQETSHPSPLKLRKLIYPEVLRDFLLQALDVSVWLLGSIYWDVPTLSF